MVEPFALFLLPLQNIKNMDYGGNIRRYCTEMVQQG